MIQKRPILEPQALKKLADLCAKGEHCSGEMLEKMRKWGLSEDAQARIMEKIYDVRFIVPKNSEYCTAIGAALQADNIETV